MFCGALWSLIILAIAIRSALVSFQEMSAMTSFLQKQTDSKQISESRCFNASERLESIVESEAGFSRASGTLVDLCSVIGLKQCNHIEEKHDD